MTGTRCRICLGHWSDCSALRLFNGRSCCAECTHGPSTRGTEEAPA